MASKSPSPYIIIGSEYGNRNSFRTTKKVSFDMKSKTAFPVFSSHDHNLTRKCPRMLRVRATDLAQESNRPVVGFPPSPWTDHFLSVRVEESEIDALSKEIEALKPRVRDMLLSSHADVKETTHLIYLLYTLCLSYHFEDDIEAILKRAFEDIDGTVADEDDLYAISITFRVFRRHGYKMSCDIFDRFKGEDGKFKQCLVSDVKGMLSLYEAAHMGTTTEDIMDEALSFTKNHLESLARRASTHLSRLIQNALYLPQHHNADLLVAREYISFYEQEDDHDQTLLQFAKLNFRYLQLQYIQELNMVTKWWKDLNLASKLPYMRDRITELYFWATILCYEPQFSSARFKMAKFYAACTLVDDTYDAYATLEEAKTLVGNLERMDPEAIEQLPGCYKTVFRFMLDVFGDLEEQMAREGKSYFVQHTKEQFGQLVRAYLQMSKWARNRTVPTLEEYMEVGKVTCATHVALTPCLMSMGPIAGRETYDWLESYPKLLDSINLKGRLINEVASFKIEMKRGEIANGINCYMKQYRVTEEEACAEFGKRLHEANKVVNDEFFKTSVLPHTLLQRTLNFARLLDISYTYGDEFTVPGGKMKEHITALFVEPLPL